MSSRSTDNGIGSGVHSTRKVPFLESVQPGISSSVPNSLPSLVRVDSVVPQSSLAEFDHSLSPLKFSVQTISSFHPHSLPEYHDALVNGAQCNSLGPISANVNFKPPEITDNCQFSRVGSSGHSFGFGEQGKCHGITWHYLYLCLCFLGWFMNPPNKAVGVHNILFRPKIM